MSLPIAFHRAASAGFIEAGSGMKASDLVLPLNSWLRLIVAYHWHLNILSGLSLLARLFGVSSPIIFPYGIYFRTEEQRIFV